MGPAPLFSSGHPAAEAAEDPIATLLTTYSELNSPSIDVLHEEPSALEFMRYVSLNRPFMVRGAAKDWKATQTWNIETLKTKLEGASVNVAITPFGYVEFYFISVLWRKVGM